MELYRNSQFYSTTRCRTASERRHKINIQERQKSYQVLEQQLEKLNKKPADLIRDLDLYATIFTAWKKGENMPNAENLYKIAKYCNVDIGIFLEE